MSDDTTRDVEIIRESLAHSQWRREEARAALARLAVSVPGSETGQALAERIRKLRNLRGAYSLHSAVDHWHRMTGEDLIEEYAKLAALVTDGRETAYERCDGKHRGGDTCTSEKGHAGACTFGLPGKRVAHSDGRETGGDERDAVTEWLETRPPLTCPGDSWAWRSWALKCPAVRPAVAASGQQEPA